ncbi:MAG: NrfD/PsrC family molybdoenzyme membrane anchor subunit [Conexivisphaerales archaeon]
MEIGQAHYRVAVNSKMWKIKKITIAAISIVLVLLALGMAYYGYNLNQIEEQVFDVPWGLDVVGYTYFALIATGSSIVNSMYTIFGYSGPNGEYKRIIKYGAWFSLSTIFSAWLLVLFSLAKPFDFTYIFLFFRISSRIAWMAALYSFFAIMLVIEVLYMILVESWALLKRIKYLELAIAILVLIATVAVHSNLGEVFGSLISMPAWYGSWLTIYFIMSAIMLGAAGQSLFIYVVKRKDNDIKSFMSRYFSEVYLIIIPIYLMYLTWIIISAWYSRETVWPVYQALLFGSDAIVFWAIEILLGIFVPLALSVYGYIKKSSWAAISAAVFLLIGGFMSKYSLIVLPQELRPYVWVTLQISNYTYFPSTGLILMFIGAAVLWPSLYALGTLIFPLEEDEKAKHLWIFR